MRRSLLLTILAAASLSAAAPAQAQNFFERLFGLSPARPGPAPGGAPAGGAAAPNPDQPPTEVPKTRAPPVQARPVALRVPPEDAVLGKDLKLNGSNGSLRLDRVAGKTDLQAKLTLVGRRGQTADACSVQLGGNLVSQGRTEGLYRYKLEEAGCSLTLDLFDDAVLVKGESCQFQTANCQADAGGMWGPDPQSLVPRARDLEASRASADKAVRENYKALVQRARPESVRPIVAEQAAFSAERETTCRSYAREAQHSFCNARYSEGRAITLAQRLGVTMASAQPAGAPGAPRTRGTGAELPNDPYGLPSTSELVERNPFDD